MDALLHVRDLNVGALIEFQTLAPIFGQSPDLGLVVLIDGEKKAIAFDDSLNNMAQRYMLVRDNFFRYYQATTVASSNGSTIHGRDIKDILAKQDHLNYHPDGAYPV